MIEDFIKGFTHKAIHTLANTSPGEQTVIVNWAKDVVEQYGFFLKRNTMKIKNIADLPYPKEHIKIAIKALLPAYLAQGSDDIVSLLKDRYVGLSTFQEISQEDKESIIKEVNAIDQEPGPNGSSLFTAYHRYMELIISEQHILLEDINTFIEDLQIEKRDR